MTITERQAFSQKLFDECLQILASKGAAYSGDKEANANFIKSAADANLSTYQIWQVFFNKHKDSIKNAITANPHRPIEKTEGMHGRILDAINYLVILASLLEDDGILSPDNGPQDTVDHRSQ